MAGITFEIILKGNLVFLYLLLDTINDVFYKLILFFTKIIFIKN
jgi:hypothetical protein